MDSSDFPLGPQPGPAVISTWDFGKKANAAAWGVLSDKGDALDAAQQGVMVIEADPSVTSVGIGGMPNSEGVVELDAALMDGKTLNAGSVAGLRGILHPVAVARKVMDETPHLLLVGEGAHRFARQQGFKKQNLLTDDARARWKERKARGNRSIEDHDTIGMVTLDREGHMAAACTTSGVAWKLPGRVGDSPLVGHGLYCDGRVGGATATGMGEEVIKVCGSYQIVEFMRQGIEPEQAVRQVCQRVMRQIAGDPNRRVAFVALRADGAMGFGSTHPGFQATATRDGRHAVLPGFALVTD